MGNEGLDSIGKGMRKSTLKKFQVESIASHSQLAKSSLTKTLQILTYASHVAFCGLALLS